MSGLGLIRVKRLKQGIPQRSVDIHLPAYILLKCTDFSELALPIFTN